MAIQGAGVLPGYSSASLLSLPRQSICPSFPRRLVCSIIRMVAITYDHRLKRTGYPVRSGILKLEIG
jgi:hypothetical protein